MKFLTKKKKFLNNLIIFTSGSTGTPKGVKITADCLNHFLEWSVGLGGPAEEKQGAVFLNQAPFSFDLSVMDLYTCLACGGTLWCLEKEVQEDYQKLMDSLKDSGAGVWVSTPSFAELCLADPGFEERLLPRLRAFLFCGETLPCATVRRLKSRFPQAVVVNTYGPTESTVAVTEVEITDTMAAGSSPLPVGRARPGTRIEIRNEKGAALPEGEQGEAQEQNPYYMEPGAWKKKESLIRRGKVKRDMVTDGYKFREETGDLKAFLAVCREMEIEPLVVILPVNGYWYDYTGYGKEARAKYYERIRALLNEEQVSYADLSGEEYTRYFFEDGIHPSGKGWTKINEILYRFYQEDGTQAEG